MEFILRGETRISIGEERFYLFTILFIFHHTQDIVAISFKMIITAYSLFRLADRSEWGVCTVRGDPHINTLDGKEWRYFGHCEYILSEFCEDNDNDFQITADFDPRAKNPSQTYAASVTLKIDGESFTIGVSGASPATGTYTTAENGYTVYVFANAANTKLVSLF